VIREFLHLLETGAETPAGLLHRCLARIRELEPDIQAWVEILPQEHAEPGPLHGVPYGAKDIFETRGLATEYGSPLYRGHKGETDARLIGLLRAAGTVLLGKTQTTAFASFDPAPTRNPRGLGHTPGGSSSGSAAAVAAGMVPFAIGTQTLGSVLRPASYCGVCGFKPSFGLIPFEGALPFAPSLDTVGLFTQTAVDMEVLWARVFNSRFACELHRAALLRVSAQEPMQQAIAAGISRLRAQGVVVDEIDPPDGWPRLAAAAQIINQYEGARTHRKRYREFGDRIGPRLASLVRSGLALPAAAYEDARARVEEMRAQVTSLFWEYPALLSPAAYGPAPEGLAGTGDPTPNSPWTALGLPAITVPLPVDGLPLGLQIAGAWGRDDALVGVAAQAEMLISPGAAATGFPS
jgi:Asp-tRNA(Asn)/Glu-tRNA(Gln) amidotransferase A subunit family amidase